MQDGGISREKRGVGSVLAYESQCLSGAGNNFIGFSGIHVGNNSYPRARHCANTEVFRAWGAEQ